MNASEQKKLSKATSQALRHNPAKYNITLDEEGWSPLPDLIGGMETLFPFWKGHITEQDFVDLMADADKQRFELKDGHIRALYGHSVEEKIQREPVSPPDVLYHGTSAEAANIILKEGLKPMSRQYVHLSIEQKTARIVGSRKTKGKPLVILTVDAKMAAENGVVFYVSNDQTYLSEPIPARFISAI